MSLMTSQRTSGQNRSCTPEKIPLHTCEPSWRGSARR